MRWPMIDPAAAPAPQLLGRLEGRALAAAAEEDLPDVPLPMGEVRGYVLLDPQTVLALVAELRIARELLADVGLSHLLVDAMAEQNAETRP
jgi:hypothetical protein